MATYITVMNYVYSLCVFYYSVAYCPAWQILLIVVCRGPPQKILKN